MTKWFKDITDLGKLKKQYFKLAKKYHPDKGGDEKIFKEIVQEYEEKLKIISDDTFDKFREILDKIINLDVTIEIIGTWIWVSGDTKKYKNLLGKNGLGFKWSKKKQMWYYHEGKYKKRSRKNLSIEEIKNKYGATTVKKASNDNTKLLA